MDLKRPLGRSLKGRAREKKDQGEEISGPLKGPVRGKFPLEPRPVEAK